MGIGQDGRDYQIIFLLGFIALGSFSRDWTLVWQYDLGLILMCLVCQGLGVLLSSRLQTPPRTLPWGLKSALITALSLTLLLRANHFSTLVLAAGVAIASKFFCRWQDKHFFNPANVGIMAALVLSGDAWISPGQWGTTGWLIACFLATGSLVLGKVGRWETSVVFLAVYSTLEILRNAWLGWDISVVLHHLGSGSLLVFALFMLSDPRSIPDGVAGRVLWATLIAGVTFIFEHSLYLPAAPFWALFCCAPLTLLCDRRWPAPRFFWLKSRPLEPYSP